MQMLKPQIGRRKSWYHVIGALFVSVLITSCFVEKPGVKEATKRSASFSHTGKEKDCNSCHLSQRPGSRNNIEHGNSQDCIFCHKSNLRWDNPRFSHKPIPEKCTICHIMNRPDKLVGKFLHSSEPGMGECSGCHSLGAGKNWARGKYNHKPDPQKCEECHENERPQKIVNGFTHSTDGKDDCKKCHLDAGHQWNKAVFAHGLEIDTCVRCHERDRPRESTNTDDKKIPGHYENMECANCHQPKDEKTIKFGFNHTSFKKVKIETCLPCHLEDGKKKHINEKQETDKDVNFADFGNCFECHKKRKSWDAE